MPRPKADEPRNQQLLLRLTVRQFEVLESVAHLERTKPSAYAHQILVEHLAAMTKNPRVQADLANRAAYDADATAATPLRERAESGSNAPPINATRSARTPNTS
jgi:hypothetical protein